MNAILDDNLNYSGTVSLQFKIGNNITRKTYHNEGTLQLKRAFAMFLCGGLTSRKALMYVPSQVDLQYRSNPNQPWDSYLIRTVPATNPVYDLDESSDEASWYVDYTAVIPYSSLIDAIKQLGEYRLCLRCNEKSIEDESTDLAYIYINPFDLLTLQAGVSLIISWRLKLLNSEPNKN